MSIVSYKAASAVVSTRPSPIIWADCPVIAFLKDPGKGFHVFDDFHECPGASTVAGSRWYAYIIASGSLALADGEKGELVMDHNDTDNDDVAITTGNNSTGCITPASLSKKKWWFEARVKAGSITTDDIGWFVGLASEGYAADGTFLADATALVAASIDHVGFRVAADDGAAVDFVWNLGDGAATAQETASVQTAVAGSYYRLGMKYDPNDNKVHVYVDGVENKSAAFLLTHASAPLDTMAVLIALKALTNATTTDTLTVDWVRYAAEY